MLSSSTTVDGEALGGGVYRNVEKLSLKGTVPIKMSRGTLKLNDSVPGLMTNCRQEIQVQIQILSRRYYFQSADQPPGRNSSR